jgi:hypothetical protein
MKVGILKRRRKPEDVASPRVSIRNHCLECMGYAISEVTLCTSPECWLYPWRLATTPAGFRQPRSPEVTRATAERGRQALKRFRQQPNGVAGKGMMGGSGSLFDHPATPKRGKEHPCL